MSLVRESFGIFRRNPINTTVVVFLMTAASFGQVVSLGSLYPIMTTLISDGSAAAPLSGGFFIRILEAIGLAPTLTNLLALFVVIGLSYSILNWCGDAFQGRHLRNFETAVRHELLDSAVRADWAYAKTLRHGEFINVVTREATQYKFVVKYALYTFSSFLQFAALLSYALYLKWQITVLGMFLFGDGS